MPQQMLAKATWWQRITRASARANDQLMPAAQRRDTDIYMELHRPNGVIKVLWPASAAAEAARWLKEMQ